MNHASRFTYAVPDETFIEQARSGSRAGFRALARRGQDGVERLAMRTMRNWCEFEEAGVETLVRGYQTFFGWLCGELRPRTSAREIAVKEALTPILSRHHPRLEARGSLKNARMRQAGILTMRPTMSPKVRLAEKRAPIAAPPSMGAEAQDAVERVRIDAPRR
jgi:hypothetical protein